METRITNPVLSRQIHNFIRTGFSPHFGQPNQTFKTNPLWQKFRRLGSCLWFDTASAESAQPLWTRQFSAMTTNNTLLNKEIQAGRYDDLIRRADELLKNFPQLTDNERKLEFAFILNAYHALRLVEEFDAYVSVEEHTDLADTVDLAVDYARRYHAICPERFIIKIPFTPAGLLATRELSAEAIPVNQTLGFSARQNYLIARIAKPQYVNVFLGRLNNFVADNHLGPGTFVGEKATLASQKAVKTLRLTHKTQAKQIGASFRSAQQLINLAGIDVMTIPPEVANDFLALDLTPEKITDQTGTIYDPHLYPNIDPHSIRLDTLWEINDQLVDCIDALEKEKLDRFTPDIIIGFFKGYHCHDVLVKWSSHEIETSTEEGKIPHLENWRHYLAKGCIGLDSVMNLAGLNSFAADQKQMDIHIKGVLAKTEKITTR